MRHYLFYLLIPMLLASCISRKTETICFEKPDKVVVIGQSTLEFMIEFGLTENIVGVAQIDIQNQKYDLAIDQLPIITRQWPSKEAILALRPDLIYTMESAFRGERIGDPDFWHQRGIATFQINDYTTGKSLASYKQDLINSGKLFDREKEVSLYLNHLEGTIHGVKQKAISYTTTPNILFLACVGPVYYYYPPSLCLLDEIIEDCGGKFIHLGDRSIILSTEAILAANPDKIIISQYLHSDAEYAKAKLLNNKLLNHASAIRNKAVLSIDYTNAVSGSIELPLVYKTVFSFIHSNS